MRALAVILLSASLAQGSILRQAQEPDTTVKPETTTEGEKPPPGPVVCPAGKRGSGGECLCDSVPGWDGSAKEGGSWDGPWCFQGACYAGMSSERCLANNGTDCEPCKGKANGHSLGDGTWCWKGRRDTQCKTSNPKVCPGGKRNPKGGECNCDDPRVFSHNVFKKVLADGGKWREPWCFEGQCYTRQASGPGSDLCVGKGVGKKFGGGLGDGSWCFNERRDITCSDPNQEEDEDEDEVDDDGEGNDDTNDGEEGDSTTTTNPDNDGDDSTEEVTESPADETTESQTEPADETTESQTEPADETTENQTEPANETTESQTE